MIALNTKQLLKFYAGTFQTLDVSLRRNWLSNVTGVDLSFNICVVGLLICFDLTTTKSFTITYSVLQRWRHNWNSSGHACCNDFTNHNILLLLCLVLFFIEKKPYFWPCRYQCYQLLAAAVSSPHLRNQLSDNLQLRKSNCNEKHKNQKPTLRRHIKKTNYMLQRASQSSHLHEKKALPVL